MLPWLPGRSVAAMYLWLNNVKWLPYYLINNPAFFNLIIRLGMEKKLKTMEIRYDSMTKAHSFLKNQHHNLKSQVTALLSLHSGKADLGEWRVYCNCICIGANN